MIRLSEMAIESNVSSLSLSLILMKNCEEKKVLVVEGGAMRSAFSAGVMDGFIANEFDPFDFYVGVSSGASNLIAYQSKKIEIGLNVLREMSEKKREITSLLRLITGLGLIDLNAVMKIIEKYKDEMCKACDASNIIACTTDVQSGEPRYRRLHRDNLMHVLRATMALPVICGEFSDIDGRKEVDGGMSDCVPIKKAIEMGGTEIMVIRSRHSSCERKDTLSHKMIRWKLSKKYPELTRTMANRTQRHRDIKRLLESPPDGINIVDVCPPAEFSMGRFSLESSSISNGYNAGLDAARSAIMEWEKYQEAIVDSVN